MTGAAGFIGRRLALTLRREGVAVRALVRERHNVADLESAGVRIVRGDVADREAVVTAAADCRVVYHLAAARGSKKLSDRAYRRDNLRMSVAVGEGAFHAGVARVVVASTVTMTGRLGPELQTEAVRPRPNSGYRASKLLTEQAFEELGQRGLDVVIVRVPQRVMGPGARDWTRLAQGVRDGRYRVLPRDGTIHSADVDDVIDGLRRCASCPGIGGELFLLGGPGPSRVTEVLAAIADHLGVAFRPRLVPGGPVRVYAALGNAVFRLARVSLPHHFTAEFFSARVALDLGKARRDLGYSPRFDMPQSVGRTVTWLRDQGLV